MPTITPALALVIFVAGTAAGSLGALLGIGGGIFLVPFLNLALGFPFTVAAAISLSTVIATSSAVSAGRAGKQLINMRFGMLLEVATVGGSLMGGVTAQLLAQSTLQRLFGAVAIVVAIVTLRGAHRRNVIADPDAATGLLGGRFYDPESQAVVSYRIKHLPVALGASFVAGNVSSLLGIGGGVIKVPALNAWCGMPLRAAAATSAFMIGVTATGGAVIYYGHGQLIPSLAAAAVLGVQVGSWGGMRLGSHTAERSLNFLLASVLLIVAALMLVRGTR